MDNIITFLFVFIVISNIVDSKKKKDQEEKPKKAFSFFDMDEEDQDREGKLDRDLLEELEMRFGSVFEEEEEKSLPIEAKEPPIRSERSLEGRSLERKTSIRTDAPSEDKRDPYFMAEKKASKKTNKADLKKDLVRGIIFSEIIDKPKALKKD